MTIELTREELFKQVWKRPMTKVAADYGNSDVALKKICDKHRIPVPGRGYWAKKSAGKNVEKAHFRTVADPDINRVVIYGSPMQKLPEPVKKARDVAKKREARPENKVEVNSAPENLHPSVERTRKKLKTAKLSKKGLLVISDEGLFDLEVGPENSARVVAFLNALVTAAEDRGYRVIKGNRALVFFVDEEPLDFKIVEGTKRGKHAPTEAELAAMDKWKRRRARDWSSASWTSRPEIPEWDYELDGRLQVIINEGHYGHDGLRRTFGDGKTQRIETLINSILEAFATWSAAVKVKRIEDERPKQEREEEERRREEQRRRNALEEKRIEVLTKDIERRQQGQQILDFVAVVEERLSAGGYDDQESVREWIDWAKGYAEQIDPLNGGGPRLLRFEDFNPWELR
jgi:hypothetical protein